ncbi:pumilio homolog 3 [Thrips palmi]|uniref:Pumilio homolog 3 n=1 Tax=Thrips palmi TaxID=161013 RepID=A0A6P9AHC4_THRPL|nr:pumilio homolog 3 [Thrips palmi]
MSVESVSDQPSKNSLKRRNNSGTFNVENPKKMKKIPKSGVGLVYEASSKGPLKKKKKRSLDAGNHDEPSSKKSKFVPDGHKKQVFKSPKKNSDTPTEKPDWNKFKEEKKTLREKRRASQKADSFEISIEAKKILETIRSRKCPAAEQIMQLEKIYSILKGKLLSVAYAHDMSRVIETMFKFGSVHKKTDLLKNMIIELAPEALEMSKRRYATHVVRAMITHAHPSERTLILEAFKGHVKKLLGHKIGHVVLEELYSKCKPSEQCELQRELYGGSHKLVTDKPVTGLEVIFESLPNMKDSTLVSTKENIMDLFEKNVVESRIVHSVLLDYLGHASPEESSQMLEQARNHFKALTRSKEGIHVAMMCVWMGTSKARKKMIKELKDGVVALAIGEHTHMLLLAIFDCVDDTVFVQKAILGELLAGDLTPLLSSTYGRKVLMYLCSKRNPKMFSSPIIATLSTGDNNPHSKKDADVRALDLQKFAVPFLLKSIAQQTTLWAQNNSNLLILLEALKVGSGDELKSALKAIAKFITNPPDSQQNGVDLKIVDDNGFHMLLKKLAQHDKVFLENGEATFGESLLEELTDNHFLAWLQNNRCCFVLLELMKNSSEDVVGSLKSKIKQLSKSVWKKNSITAGAQRIQELL